MKGLGTRCPLDRRCGCAGWQPTLTANVTHDLRLCSRREVALQKDLCRYTVIRFLASDL